ncbi:MetQ/NlpA family ABC transporter substrate-binding protein [Mycetocola spongiae]|uniref:MetQ/NlpA family ABC transporter substrate-binding protein n=1 Tax=Mycetocola spongiae TaxID=2859226 RepID=UPI001CF4AA9D|nr:MetQ/NlpA family ABC transporter substrate-binding protein [Mycetocola spongiae]UCR89555.1 hypothetical protein KXZ72_02355 [Mycetocola spongiae]
MATQNDPHQNTPDTSTQVEDAVNSALGKRRGQRRRLALIGGIAAASLIAVGAVATVLAISARPDAQAAEPAAQPRQEITLGVGDVTPTWDAFVKVADRDYNIGVKLQVFSDWNLPNEALANGEIDANAFQHVLFLSQYNVSSGHDLKPVGVTSLGTLGLYSAQATTIGDIAEGGKILVPNDPTNQGRALRFLEAQKLISLDADAGLFAGIEDITTNPHSYEFVPLVAQQIPTSLPDAAAAVSYQSTAVKAGIPADSVLVTDADLVHTPAYLPYQAVFAAQAKDANLPVWADLEKAYHSDEVVAAYHLENEGRGAISQASLPDVLRVQAETEKYLREQK